MHPHRHLELGLGHEDAVADQMADDGDDDIGRQVVGPVVMKLGPAGLAMVDDGDWYCPVLRSRFAYCCFVVAKRLKYRPADLPGRPLALPPPHGQHRLPAATHARLPLRLDAGHGGPGAGPGFVPYSDDHGHFDAGLWTDRHRRLRGAARSPPASTWSSAGDPRAAPGAPAPGRRHARRGRGPGRGGGARSTSSVARELETAPSRGDRPQQSGEFDGARSRRPRALVTGCEQGSRTRL